MWHGAVRLGFAAPVRGPETVQVNGGSYSLGCEQILVADNLRCVKGFP